MFNPDQVEVLVVDRQRKNRGSNEVKVEDEREGVEEDWKKEELLARVRSQGIQKEGLISFIEAFVK